ncbi:hypothetical protein FOZ63_012043, partial [Perkinsus olseni]
SLSLTGKDSAALATRIAGQPGAEALWESAGYDAAAATIIRLWGEIRHLVYSEHSTDDDGYCTESEDVRCDDGEFKGSCCDVDHEDKDSISSKGCAVVSQTEGEEEKVERSRHVMVVNEDGINLPDLEGFAGEEYEELAALMRFATQEGLATEELLGEEEFLDCVLKCSRRCQEVDEDLKKFADYLRGDASIW